MPESLRVERLWKVFAPPGSSVDTEDPEALSKLEASGGVVAVRDVSFTLERGEFFVIMGLSGSGKSTLIRCLIRLIEPTAGHIFVDGEDITALDRRGLTAFRRRKAAMVFQHYGLLPHKSVIENAAFGLKLRGVPKAERLERAREALERVGLVDWIDRYPSELSGGMRQRVGIARALANDPEILLMDEPFSGLDPLIRRDLQDEFMRLQQELKKTVVFVTHDLNEATRLGDRMAVMRAGEFVQVAAPREILTNPADEYVARFVEGLTQRLDSDPEADVPAALKAGGGDA